MHKMLSMTKKKLTRNRIREEDHTSFTFEEILDQYLYDRPKRGQILEGEIETIDEDAIILDVGLKRAAIVPKREVSNLDEEDFAKSVSRRCDPNSSHPDPNW